MAVHFSLMNACTRMSSSSALRLTAMEKSGRTSWMRGACSELRSPGPRRREDERADRGVLVVERRDHEAPDAVVEHVLLDGRPVRIGGEVLDEQGLALERGALVHRARVVGQRVVHGVREEARVLARGPGAQLEHAVALDGGEAEAKVGPAQERPEPRLERVEARAGDDRLLVDQVALEARQHFLIRHVERPEHGEAAEPDAARREHGGERLEVPGAAPRGGRARRGRARAGSPPPRRR